MQDYIVICDDLIRSEAMVFAKELNIPDEDLNFSDGWLTSFKKRYGIKFRVLNGEEASIDPEIINTNLPILQEKLNMYDPNDIYNFDETALFYAMEPNKTLASKGCKGRKVCKDRITLGLCSNSTGTEKLIPVVIGKYGKPRCFNGININNLGVDYFFNTKAWMTSNIFTKWISKLDKKLRESKDKRHILLILDNASSHKIDFSTLTNIEILFLPPNTTSKIQPMDAGIIYSFKRKYKLKYTKWLYDRYKNDKTDKKKIDLKTSITYAVESWNDVSLTTIKNCWKHTKLIKFIESQENGDKLSISNEDDEFREIICRLEIVEPFDFNEYINYEEIFSEKTEEKNNDEILEMDETSEENPREESSFEENKVKKVKKSEAFQAINTLKNFMEQSNINLSDEIKNLRDIERKIRFDVETKEKQLTIFECLNINKK